MTKPFHLIGCKYCDISDWDILTDGEEFIMRCKKCNNNQEIKKENLRTKPTKVYPMRFF